MKAKYIRDNAGKALAMEQNNNLYYYLYNAHGDVTGLTDSSGNLVLSYKYDEFGNLKSSTGSVYNPLRHSGANNAYYDEETGLYKMGVRYYNPEVGRWITRDDYRGSYEDPSTRNQYVYLSNNPIGDSDPSGFISMKKALCYARKGDVIFRKTDGGLRYWSHVALCCGSIKRFYPKKGKSLTYSKGRMSMAEAVPKIGTRLVPIWYEYMKTSPMIQKNCIKIGIGRRARPLTRKQKNLIAKLGRKYGKAHYPYNIASIITNTRTMNCTELVWRAYYYGTNGVIDMRWKMYKPITPPPVVIWQPYRSSAPITPDRVRQFFKIVKKSS